MIELAKNVIRMIYCYYSKFMLYINSVKIPTDDQFFKKDSEKEINYQWVSRQMAHLLYNLPKISRFRNLNLFSQGIPLGKQDAPFNHLSFRENRQKCGYLT